MALAIFLKKGIIELSERISNGGPDEASSSFTDPLFLPFGRI